MKCQHSVQLSITPCVALAEPTSIFGVLLYTVKGKSDPTYSKRRKDSGPAEQHSWLQPCHTERSEASRPSSQILRGVYPERSEWAQDDNRGKLYEKRP